MGFDTVEYDISSLETDLEILVTTASAADKLIGTYTVTKTDTSGATTVVQTDTLEGIERIAHAEKRANTYLSGGQTESSVTGMLGNGFVVVWKSQGQGGQSTGIYAQRFDIHGDPVGSEIAISSSSQTSGYNLSAQVVDTQDGGFAVVWQGRDGSRRKVFASKFDSSGDDVFEHKKVFEDPDTGNPAQDNPKKTQEYQPSIDVLSNGNLAISAEAYGDSMDYADIITQVLSGASGDRIGDNEDVAINQETSNNQTASQVVALSGGGYVVIWTDSSGEDGSQSGVFGRLVSSTGSATYSEFQINQSYANEQVGQHATALSDGSFIVTWASSHDSGNFDIYFRHFDSDGDPLSNEIRVNDETIGAQVDPEIVMLDDNRFVVVFQDQNSSTDGSGAAIVGQQYRFDDVNETYPAVGKNFVVNVTANNSQREPAIGRLDDGDFAVSWTSDEAGGAPGDEIFYRVYSTSDAATYDTDTGIWT